MRHTTRWNIREDLHDFYSKLSNIVNSALMSRAWWKDALILSQTLRLFLTLIINTSVCDTHVMTKWEWWAWETMLPSVQSFHKLKKYFFFFLKIWLSRKIWICSKKFRKRKNCIFIDFLMLLIIISDRRWIFYEKHFSFFEDDFI